MSDNAFAAWVEVLPDFSNFRRKAGSEMSDILGTAGTAGGLAAGRGAGEGILGGIRGIAGPIVGVVAALGLSRLVGEAIGAGIRYAVDAVPLASNLAETRSAITQVFGDASADIQAYAETANKSLGQTRQAALSGAQTFGVFGKSAGLIGKPLANFSTGLVTLSGDLASFYNSTPQEAIDAIGAGLRGEAEPLRRFGVLLDDATLKQRALVMGIYDGSGALTSQQRILASQAEIYAQTGIAQGDFERTSGGLANQQRILAASLEDTQAKLGEALLPAMTSLVTYANDNLIPKLDGIIDRIGPKLAAAIDTAGPKLMELADNAAPLLEFAVDKGLPALLDSVNADLSSNGVIGGLPQVMTQLDQFFNDYLPRWAAGTVPVQESWDGFFSWWDLAWDGSASTVENKSDEIKSYWLSSIDSTVKELMQKGVDWVGVGGHYGDGLAEGFRNSTSTVHDAAAQLANEAIFTVRGVMGIKSPSKVAAELGGYVAEGFALGITGGTPMVASAVTSMVSIPSMSIDTSLVAARASAGGDTYQINGAADPEAVALSVARRQAARAV